MANIYLLHAILKRRKEDKMGEEKEEEREKTR
jgi:hypothetical protein